jgi:hypothetical protein
MEDENGRCREARLSDAQSRKNFWRRGPESNRAIRICNPVHNRFATAPCENRMPDGRHRVTLAKKRKRELLPFGSGAGEESRTLDLNLGKVALYQLSYSRMIAALQHRESQNYRGKKRAGARAGFLAPPSPQ